MSGPAAIGMRIARFGLTTPDVRRLAAFYAQAFGCKALATARHTEDELELLGVVGGATGVGLALGEARIELMQFDEPGRPYPTPASSSDLIFQHFAIVVADMARAFQRLSAVEGWTTISTDGPERLPAASGGVTAFKFRDPDGHPLEFLAFAEGKTPTHWRARPPGELFLGIDHTAIVVADVARSILFYSGLSFEVAARSHNRGPEQDRLDAAPHADVDVVKLEPPVKTPHIELLRYQRPDGEAPPLQANDVAASRTVLEENVPSEVRRSRLLSDPDGHRILIMSSPSS